MNFKIWAIGDLHLSFGVPNKSMEVFGPAWKSHAEQIAHHWKQLIHPEDLVLIPGDISWAMRWEEALVDLKWIDALPGTKVMIKGNHDYWWGSLQKMVASLPPSIHLIQNNAFHWKEIAIGGARLWDTPEYNFNPFIEFRENPQAKVTASKEELIQEEMAEKLFNRELERLKLSLKAMKPDAKLRIAMTHYPPIGSNMEASRASQILEEHRINICVFGHLHSIREGVSLFGERGNIRYVLTSSDYLRFQPVLLV